VLLRRIPGGSPEPVLRHHRRFAAAALLGITLLAGRRSETTAPTSASDVRRLFTKIRRLALCSSPRGDPICNRVEGKVSALIPAKAPQ
jgi:hypothetical protein